VYVLTISRMIKPCEHDSNKCCQLMHRLDMRGNLIVFDLAWVN